MQAEVVCNQITAAVNQFKRRKGGSAGVSVSCDEPNINYITWISIEFLFGFIYIYLLLVVRTTEIQSRTNEPHTGGDTW